MNELITNYLPTAMLLVGVLAFTVAVIIEVIKELPGLNEIPTDLVVILLSELLTLLTFFAYVSYAKIAVVWYYVAGTVIAGIFVAFIAMFGWAKITELYDRFKKQ